MPARPFGTVRSGRTLHLPLPTWPRPLAGASKDRPVPSVCGAELTREVWLDDRDPSPQFRRCAACHVRASDGFAARSAVPFTA